MNDPTPDQWRLVMTLIDTLADRFVPEGGPMITYHGCTPYGRLAQVQRYILLWEEEVQQLRRGENVEGNQLDKAMTRNVMALNRQLRQLIGETVARLDEVYATLQDEASAAAYTIEAPTDAAMLEAIQRLAMFGGAPGREGYGQAEADVTVHTVSTEVKGKLGVMRDGET